MLGHFKPGKMMVTINRGDYWQCAFIIRKDSFEQLKQSGIQKLRDDIGEVAPFLRDRTCDLARLERREPAFCSRRSPAQMVAARPALHRRLGARDVARRWHRHQSRDSGRCRDREYLRGSPSLKIRSSTARSKLYNIAAIAHDEWTQAFQVQAHKRVVESDAHGKISYSSRFRYHCGCSIVIPWLRQLPGARHWHGFPARTCADHVEPSSRPPIFRPALPDLSASRLKRARPNFDFHAAQRILLLPVSCPICEKRKAQRFCPAKGEKICAVCCGKEREVIIDCPVDCPLPDCRTSLRRRTPARNLPPTLHCSM